MIRSTIVIVSSRSMAPVISDTIGFLVVPIAFTATRIILIIVCCCRYSHSSYCENAACH